MASEQKTVDSRTSRNVRLLSLPLSLILVAVAGYSAITSINLQHDVNALAQKTSAIRDEYAGLKLQQKIFFSSLQKDNDFKPLSLYIHTLDFRYSCGGLNEGRDGRFAMLPEPTGCIGQRTLEYSR